MSNRVLYSILSLIIVSYPALILYSGNINELNLEDIISTILLIDIIAFTLFLIIYIFVKKYINALLFTCCIMIVIMNFKSITNSTNDINIYYWHLVPVFIYFITIIIYYINKILRSDISQNILKIFTIACIVSILFNGYQNLFKNKKQENNNVSTTNYELNDYINNLNITNITDKKPNIYFLIVDEYCSFNQINKWYNYDNNILKDFLLNNNFHIIHNGHNESIGTLFVTTNYINFDYVVEDNNFDKAYKLRENPQLFMLMEKLGYSISFYGGPTIIYKGVNNNGTQGGLTITGESFFDIIFLQSIFYPLFTNSSIAEKDEQIAKKDQQFLKIMETNAVKKDNPPLFTFVHINGPHVPFVYDENGNRVSVLNRENLANKSFYLGAFKFTTKLVINTLTNIIKNDPSSIIIFFSDHSQRTLVNHADLAASEKNPITKHDAANYFSAVYFGNNKIDDIGDTRSGVNVIRYILDKEFKLNLGDVNVP